VQVLVASDLSHVGETRRAALAEAGRLGFDAQAAGAVALVATELASNLIKHAGRGEVLLSAYEDGAGSGVQLVALDRGPGIADIALSMSDGYSTAGTAGGGLGAIRRQSSAFEVFSLPGLATAVLARVPRLRPPPQPEAAPVWAGFSSAQAGEAVCGDAWQARPVAGGLDVLVVDGLGHGPLAASAAQEAIRLFAAGSPAPPPAAVARLHAGLRGTRGAALAVAQFDAARGKVVFCGIGNISGSLHVDGSVKKMVSLNGTVGHVARKIAAFDYPYDPSRPALTILHSDGIATSWSLAAYPKLVHAHPAIVAAVLHRDFRRNDDATIVAVRTRPR